MVVPEREHVSLSEIGLCFVITEAELALLA